jgi:NAD(P)-dependent dehydrogenase (short-subunit alcohol dehydrogenase family)
MYFLKLIFLYVLLHSIAGHSIPHLDMVVHMYCASKHAVTALTEGLRRELVKQNSKIRVSVSVT